MKKQTHLSAVPVGKTFEVWGRKLTIQQYKTLKRQIEAGDTEGFYKGIRKIFRIKGKSYDETDII